MSDIFGPQSIGGNDLFGPQEFVPSPAPGGGGGGAWSGSRTWGKEEEDELYVEEKKLKKEITTLVAKQEVLQEKLHDNPNAVDPAKLVQRIADLEEKINMMVSEYVKLGARLESNGTRRDQERDHYEFLEFISIAKNLFS